MPEPNNATNFEAHCVKERYVCTYGQKMLLLALMAKYYNIKIK